MSILILKTVGNPKKFPWLKEHLFLLVFSFVTLTLLIVSVSTTSYYPYVNIMLSMIVGGAFIYKTIRGRESDNRLITSGVRTTGKVTDMYEEHGWTGVHSMGSDFEKRDSYFIKYTFASLDGKQILCKHEIGKNSYKYDIEIGYPVDIAFDPAHPKRSIPIGVGGIKEFDSLGKIIWNAIGIAVVTFIASILLKMVFD